MVSDLPITLTIAGPLPQHSRVLVTAFLNFIDNWNGETASISIDGEVKWMKSVTAQPNSVSMCGVPDYKEAAFNVPVLFEATPSSDSLVLTFSTSFPTGTDPCSKSLGIDNVIVYIK